MSEISLRIFHFAFNNDTSNDTTFTNQLCL